VPSKTIRPHFLVSIQSLSLGSNKSVYSYHQKIFNIIEMFCLEKDSALGWKQSNFGYDIKEIKTRIRVFGVNGINFLGG